MSVTEDRRIALLEAAHQHWGRDVAVTLMEMLPPSGWGDVATRQRVDALEHHLDLRFQLADQKLEALETALDARIDQLEARVDARIDRLETHMDRLATRIDGVDTSLGSRIDGLETRLDTLEIRLAGLGEVVAGEFSLVRREMAAGFAVAEARTVRWVVGTGIAIVGALTGLGGLVLALH